MLFMKVSILYITSTKLSLQRYKIGNIQKDSINAMPYRKDKFNNVLKKEDNGESSNTH